MKGSVFFFTHYDIFPGQMSYVNHRGPYVAPLEKWFQRRFLEIHNLYRGFPIDASYKIPSVGSSGKAVSEEKCFF
jgi:hypothetical protein